MQSTSKYKEANQSKSFTPISPLSFQFNSCNPIHSTLKYSEIQDSVMSDIVKVYTYRVFKWLERLGLNQRPLPCEGRLQPKIIKLITTTYSFAIRVSTSFSPLFFQSYTDELGVA
jgi:hypothetical protein